nr:MAG TPA: hypothetical protein [Caudoviricetes sp.]
MCRAWHPVILLKVAGKAKLSRMRRLKVIII